MKLHCRCQKRAFYKKRAKRKSGLPRFNFYDVLINGCLYWHFFDYASPSSKNLFDNWEKKDPKDLVFNKLNFSDFIGYIFAYGDYENECEYDQKVNIKERQLLIKSHIRGLHEIHLPKNNTGTPKHPIVWQRQKMKSDITVLLRGIA